MSEGDIQELKILYKDITDKMIDMNSNTDSLPDCYNKLVKIFHDYKKQFSAYRTARLWLQYLDYVSILKCFIRAERTSDWHLHLHSLARMLNLFAATGHKNYAKSGRLYLQLMYELPTKYPWLYQQFTAGRFNTIRRSDRFWAGLSTDLVIEQVMMRSIKSRGGLTHGRGMSESVRLTWVASMHKCGSIQAAITRLTNLDHSSDDAGYADVGKSRRIRDFNDLLTMIQWFESSNPFRVLDHRLHSLSTGKAASDIDGINCDRAEEVGAAIMKKMDGMCFGEIVLKKVDRARTLANVSMKMPVGDKKIAIGSNILFSRLLIVMQRSTDMEPFFRYELTAEPTALFKDNCLRKPDKSVLSKELKKNLDSGLSFTEAKVYVIDGGWLLHKVKWQKGLLYRDIIKQYVDYVTRNFGSKVTIVFDGYGNGPCTKDHEHDRRSLKAAPDVVYEDHKPCIFQQEAFLANESNKKSFVQALINSFNEAGYLTNQALNDADTLIVYTALQIAVNEAVTVVANDTDVLVLLLYHFQDSLADIFMRSDGTKKNVSSQNIVPVRELKCAVGTEASQIILALHAISGCDTTSSLFGIGKGKALKKFIKNKEAFNQCQIISDCTASHDDVFVSGCKLTTILYGGKVTESLNHLRYVLYMNCAASSTIQPRPERLPPTENASRFHVYRVHLQVVQWKTLMSTDLKAEDWGWKFSDGRYIPIATDLAPAPEDLLKIVRCKCKLETQRPCTTQLCSCMKHGLPCVRCCMQELHTRTVWEC